MKKIILKRKKIFKKFIYSLFLIIFYTSLFINIQFNNVSFEQLIYTISNSKGSNYDIVIKGTIFIIISLFITFLLSFIIKKVSKLINFSVYFNFKIKNKIFKFKLSEIFINVFTIALFTILCSIELLKIDNYIAYQYTASTLFENYYVDSRDVTIKFPEKKRNLIYIYVESLESSNISKKNGGLVEKSYTPNLEKLALENTNFSHNEKIGGAYQVNNSGWTIAALVSQTAGIPLKIPIDDNLYKGYGASLPGVYNLGDILLENGYTNYFMIGSDADFGGRKDYFEYHGNYNIYDYHYAVEKNYIERTYFENWGYEDLKLFEFSKEELTRISQLDTPFNFTMLTTDTHFIDGYLDNTCDEPFDQKYANAFHCSDSKISSFIRWIQQQDFYENTTIIISGDHLTMQYDFYKEEDSNRNVYNVFINSALTPQKEKNRIFSSLDMFPTTLASLGVEIENNKLGLGVNLFSEEETLLEQFGINYINEEISKKSFYYDYNILEDTYFQMLNKKENQK